MFSFDNALTETVKTTDVVEESSVQESCVEDMPNQAVQTMTPVHVLDATSVGKFCIITYDGKPYAGKILSVDENVEVNCMHSVRNRYDPFANVFFGHSLLETNVSIHLSILIR